MSPIAPEIDVLILAAGFGKRLKPLTDSVPKPLVKVGGKPLIVWHLERLSREGFSTVFVNAHHLADQLEQYLGDGSQWGLSVRIIREDPILDTGGAVKNIESLISSDRLLVVNSDAFFGADFSLLNLCSYHCERDTLATLVVRECPEVVQYGLLGLSEDGRIVKFLDAGTESKVIKDVMFAGAQVIEKKGFSYFDEFGNIFSLTKDFYRKLISHGEPVYGQLYGGYWNDVGTPERLAEVELELER